jgi:hypothetical protein
MNNSEMLHKVFSLTELSALHALLEHSVKEDPNGYGRQAALRKIEQALEDY